MTSARPRRPTLWYRAKTVFDRLIGRLGARLSQPLVGQEYELAPAPPLVSIAPPLNADHLPPAFLAQLTQPVACPRQVIHRLRAVNVAWHGSVVKGLRVFVPSLPLPVPVLESELAGTFLLRQLASREAPALVGPVGLVFNQWAVGNYFHWLVEALPRLALLRKHFPDCIVLLPGPAPAAYITETVKAFGCTRIHYLLPGDMLRIPDLLVVAVPGIRGYIVPALVQEVRTTILAACLPARPAEQAPQRRIYASRNRQGWRRLTNEAEVVALLTRYGFETVYFEEMSFAEQVLLMQETAILVGIHGANLTNLLFLPADGQVVEILSEAYGNPAYLYLANSVGRPYSVIPATLGSPPSVSLLHADMTADVALVEAVIRPLCLTQE